MEQRKYTVKFGDADNLCSCNCPDFKRHRLLCKHFFAVFLSKKASFNDLSTLFINDPYFTIDTSVTEGERIMQGPSQIVEAENPNDDSLLMVASGGGGEFSGALPARKKTAETIFKKERDMILNRMKVITEDIYNMKVTADSDMDLLKFKLQDFENVVSDIKRKQNDDGLVQHSNVSDRSGVALAEYPAEPPRRYDIEHDLQIYNPRLPKSKKITHPYSGRSGAKADIMKTNYLSKCPLPKQRDDSKTDVIIDGVVDIDNMEVDFAGQDDDVDLEHGSDEEDDFDF